MVSGVHDRVQLLLPQLRNSAARTEAERQLPDDSMNALRAAGVMGLLRPVSFGGTADVIGFLDAVRALSSACGSTGWVAAHLGGACGLLATFEDRALHEIWTPDADTAVAVSLHGRGTVAGRPGSLRLTGRWPQVAGCRHAAWFLLVATAEDGRAVLVLLPADQGRIEDTWNEVGLIAAGSHTVVAEDAAVPAFRMVDLSGTAGDLGPASVLSASVAMSVVGAAQGAWDSHVEQMRARVTVSHGGEDVAERGLSPVRVARAASEIDAAVLELQAIFRGSDDRLPPALAADAWRDQRRAVERAWEAAGLVFDSVRSHALTGDAVARFWRDARVGAYHASRLVACTAAVSLNGT